MENDDLFQKVLYSAAKLQKLVPGTVLVGGSAASIYAHHRVSMDHDHVLNDLNERFELVFSALNSDPGWSTFSAKTNKIILGKLDGVEAGIRQIRRAKPLETEEYILASGEKILVPTLEEMTRIKAYFICNRNQVRDYIDTAALTDVLGVQKSANVLSTIDVYYSDLNRYENNISTELVRHLANPDPKDSKTINNLSDYKGIVSEYKNWENVVKKSQNLASEMIKYVGISEYKREHKPSGRHMGR